jgi:hypothetical protein
VSLFVLSSEIEERDEVEVATGRSTKRSESYYVYYFIFKRITKKRSDINSFISLTVIPSSLVAILLVLEGSVISFSKVY